MDKFAHWLIHRMKPFVEKISQLVGFITIYIGIAYLLSEIYSLNYYEDGSDTGIGYYFIGLVILTFGLYGWAKEFIIEKAIKEKLTRFQGDIPKIIDKKGFINHEIQNEITREVACSVYKECSFYLNAISESESEQYRKLEDKVKKEIWRRLK